MKKRTVKLFGSLKRLKNFPPFRSQFECRCFGVFFSGSFSCWLYFSSTFISFGNDNRFSLIQFFLFWLVLDSFFRIPSRSFSHSVTICHFLTFCRQLHLVSFYRICGVIFPYSLSFCFLLPENSKMGHSFSCLLRLSSSRCQISFRTWSVSSCFVSKRELIVSSCLFELSCSSFFLFCCILLLFRSSDGICGADQAASRYTSMTADLARLENTEKSLAF